MGDLAGDTRQTGMPTSGPSRSSCRPGRADRDVYKPRQNVRLNWQIEGQRKRASQAGLLARYALLPLAAGACWSSGGGVPITPFIAVAAMITITAAWTFGTARYRVAVDVVVIVAAAVCVDAVLRRWWAVPQGGPRSTRDERCLTGRRLRSIRSSSSKWTPTDGLAVLMAGRHVHPRRRGSPTLGRRSISPARDHPPRPGLGERP